MKTVRNHHVSAPLTGVGQVASSLGTDRQSSPVAVAMKNFSARPGAISRAGSQDERRRLLIFSRTASCRLYPLQRTANRVPCVPGTGGLRVRGVARDTLRLHCGIHRRVPCEASGGDTPRKHELKIDRASKCSRLERVVLEQQYQDYRVREMPCRLRQNRPYSGVAGAPGVVRSKNKASSAGKMTTVYLRLSACSTSAVYLPLFVRMNV